MGAARGADPRDGTATPADPSPPTGSPRPSGSPPSDGDDSQLRAGPATEAGAGDARTERVAAARAAWTRHLVDLGGRNTLLWYRDLPSGTLDLSAAHPAGLAQLLAGRATRLAELVREPTALEDARRRARVVAAKSRELAEERGIVTCFLAIGMASWTVRAPDGRVMARRPAAPVFLRACTLRPTGAARLDHVLELDDELELNPVLAHYLASEQGIDVDADELEALVAGDAAFDPYPAYAALADACATMADFAIDPRLVVGTFSYAKLPMVADLAGQGDRLADHDVVAALAGDPDALRAVRAELRPGSVDLDDEDRDVLVLDADSSQREAVEAVRSGSHLVIHGPPGTGKSQTIANLVSALAADGKRVLFVAEKRAAIDAVLGRLAAVGLADLVLDLHAGAHGRRRVARELVAGLDRLLAVAAGDGPAAPGGARPGGTGGVGTAASFSSAGGGPAGMTTLASAVDVRATASARLRDHVAALHEVRTPWGVTLHEVQEAVSAFAARSTPPRSRVRLRGAHLAALDRAAAARSGAALADLASLAEWAGPGHDDPWFGAAVRSADEVEEARRRVGRLSGGMVDDTAATLAGVFHGIRLPEAPTTRDWGEVLRTVGAVRDTLEVFRPEVFDIPLGDLVAATGSGEYRSRSGVELSWLDRWRLRRQARALLRPGRPPADLHAALLAASEQRLAWQRIAGSGGRPEIPVELDRARAAHTALVDDLDWVDARLPGAGSTPGGSGHVDGSGHADGSGHVDGPGDIGSPGGRDEPAALVDLDLPRLRHRVGELDRAAHRLGAAPAVRSGLDLLGSAGLTPLVHDARARRLTPEAAAAEAEWVWWSSIADEVSHADPRVAAHDGRALSRAVATYADADRVLVRDNAARVRAAVANRAEDVRAERPDQESLLRAEAARSRRLAPLRDLVVRCPDLVTAARPCWAMSPLVVASVLPPGRQFDVVVFDEASQVPPAEAVSAISRARQVVVAGDAHQLPPTTFFTSVSDGDDDAPEALTEGVESVLDVLAAALPARRLSWHYRSLDERLVAFANAAVYDGSLVTFPGTGIDPVVRHVLVEGHGIVGDGEAAVETTGAEVDRVVELVLDHAATRPGRSLGVIALGSTHAQRVEEAVRRALAAADEPHAEFFADDRPEPFFVKNLERVQGDERDDVILTIGYGKTPHGRVLHRFGPLNVEGGERRLNVAVTRARRSMTVVSSIAARDLDPDRLKARGAVLLRDFLAYAATGALPSSAPAPTDGSPPSARLVADLARRLRSHGLVVHEGIGSSAQVVDVAVEAPGEPGRLLLAVESDGPRYASVPSTRDRDRLRAEHLERLGWRHLRVWSTDLYRDPAREVARVLDVLGVGEPPDG
ncbi:MAG: AAA domain-containing protein [Phycicoccus sp.]